MKILVVSLLRLGDIILTAPVLESLRARHPEARIDLLVNAQFARVGELLPQVNKIYKFERERLQAGLGKAEIPLFEPFDRLEYLLDELNAQDYDEVINLTHTRLSGWLTSLIPAPKRTGLVMDHHGRGVFGANWFRFLNQQVDVEGTETFHFTDIFRFGLGFDDEATDFGLRETDAGRAEAEVFLAASNGPVICIQVFSSDVKKDWSLRKWIDAIRGLKASRPEAQIILIGAPNEREKLQPLADATKSEVAIVSFAGAYSLLKRARLLVSVDTSIKHLAAAARCPTVELCLGSSDANRTGTYLDGAVIIQSREACAPCVHSKGCHRDHHACGDRIPAAVVSLVAAELYSGRKFQLETIAEEYKNEVEICQVRNGEGYWAAPSVREPFSEAAVARWIDLTCKKVWLNPNPARGSEILALSTLLRHTHRERSAVEWARLLGDFETQAEYVAARMNGLKVSLHHLKADYESPHRFREFASALSQLRERIRTLPLLRSFAGAMDSVLEDQTNPPFTRFRRGTEVVSEMDRRTNIYLSIIRGLRDELGLHGTLANKEERA